MNEERIKRMAESGVLNPEQAAVLSASLGGSPVRDIVGGAHRRSRWPWMILGAAVLTAAVVVVASLIGGDTAVNDPQNVSKMMNTVGGTGEMNKMLAIVLSLGLILVLPVVAWIGLHNSLVAKEEAVVSAWAQVESNYQRRSDLIPALVDTVSRYLRHERQTLVDVTEARSSNLAPLKSAVDDLVAAQKASAQVLAAIGGEPPAADATLKSLSEAQSRVGSGMHRLIALVEAYPQLRSSEHFLSLQSQLEGTENRINVARVRFNEAARVYNAAIRKVPGSIIASAGDFRRKAYFKAEEGTATPPTLQFDG